MPYKANEPRRHKIPRARYRVTNWPEYDGALQRRGSLTVWVTPEGSIGGGPRSPPPSIRMPRRGSEVHVIPDPADQAGSVGLGHLWKSVCGLMVVGSRRRQRAAMVASSASRVAKCLLTTA